MNNDQTLELARLIASALIERRDVKASQQSSGAYMPVLDGKDGPRLPWKLSDIVDHLEGRRTYGHYLVSQEGTVRMFAFDIDLSKQGAWKDNEGEWHDCSPREVWVGPDSPAQADLRAQLISMATGLAMKATNILGIKTCVAYSGSKGLHVYGLMDRGTPAALAREAMQAVIDGFQCFVPVRGKNFYRHETEFRALEIETYPKQDAVREGDGLGNLLRLPLGVNRKTGHRGYFVKIKPTDDPHNAFQEDDPFLALQEGSYR